MPVTVEVSVPSGINSANPLKYALLISNSLTFKILPMLYIRLLVSNEKIMRIASIGGILSKRSEALPAISVTPISCNK